MAKETNAIDLDPDAYMQSLLTKIEKLVGLKEASIEMFNHDIDYRAKIVVQEEASKVTYEIEGMIEEVKERLKTLKEYHQE